MTNNNNNIKMGHGLAEASKDCPKCGASPEEHTVQNYDILWGDGDVVCTKCDTKVRNYDAR